MAGKVTPSPAPINIRQIKRVQIIGEEIGVRMVKRLQATTPTARTTNIYVVIVAHTKRRITNLSRRKPQQAILQESDPITKID